MSLKSFLEEDEEYVRLKKEMKELILELFKRREENVYLKHLYRNKHKSKTKN